MLAKYPILFTRRLKATDIEYARLRGIEPSFEPALKITFPEYWDEVLSVIAQHRRAPWIFTSQNAVKALCQMMEEGLQPEPGTPVYAVGPKTRQRLRELDIDAVIPSTHDAWHLAGLIQQSYSGQNLIYFKGNRSLETVEKKLWKKGFSVHTIEVYQTHFAEISIPNRHFEGVVFYSPSAVKAFELSNGFKREWPWYFAIGPTTAHAIQKFIKDETRLVYPQIQSTRDLLNTISNTLQKHS